MTEIGPKTSEFADIPDTVCAVPNIADITNERRVNWCYQMMLDAQHPESKTYWWGRMQHYIAKRSPEQVQRMEREKGL